MDASEVVALASLAIHLHQVGWEGDLADYFHHPLGRLTPEQIREYTVHVIKRWMTLVLWGGLVRHHNGIAGLQRDIALRAPTFYHRVVIERQAVLFLAPDSDDMDFLALGVIGQSAGLAQRLHHRHAIRIGDGSFLLYRT